MRTFNLEYRIVFPHGQNIVGTQEVKGMLFMTAAWKLQRRLKKEYSKACKGVNVFINLNDQSKYEK